MNSLKGSFVSALTYNSLPHIHQTSHVPENNSADLNNLRALLAKHDVPKWLSVRLIHKHFDIEDGEVMVISEVAVPSQGKVQVMRPTEIAAAHQLHGIHFFVDMNGTLQAYEYSLSKIPDTPNLEPFLAEFCRVVMERGLQHKFGLKVHDDSNQDQTGWTEFEFPEERSTIMIPIGMPIPEGKYEISVPTEWHAEEPLNERNCSHTTVHCTHCIHCSHRVQDYSHDPKFRDLNGVDLYFGGQKLEPGTPFHGLLTAVTEVW